MLSIIMKFLRVIFSIYFYIKFEYIKFGNGAGASNADLRILHDGTNNVITSDTGTNIRLVNHLTGGNETMAQFIPNGAAELYHNGSKKLETTSDGITVTGNLLPEANNTRNIGNGSTNFNSIWASTRFRGNDNVSLQLGNSVDFKIRHDGTHNLIEAPTGADLKIMAGTGDNANETCAIFNHNGADLELEDITVQQVQEGFLNFDPNKLITGVNILDGMLFWTDNNSEPKKINIEKCKAGAYSVLNSPNENSNWTTTTKNIDPNGNVRGNITESDITVIKEYPLHAPKMSLFNTTKEPDLVLESTCTTPLNTTYDYNKPYWLGTSEGGGSSDIMEYKVKVVEVFELERYYFVEAKNKAEAKKLAKNDDWYDAQDIQANNQILVKIKVKKVEENK